jgi:uncharacterized protein YkwD
MKAFIRAHRVLSAAIALCILLTLLAGGTVGYLLLRPAPADSPAAAEGGTTLKQTETVQGSTSATKDSADKPSAATEARDTSPVTEKTETTAAQSKEVSSSKAKEKTTAAGEETTTKAPVTSTAKPKESTTTAKPKATTTTTKPATTNPTTAKPTTTTAATTAKPALTDKQFADEVFRLTNVERVKAGLPALTRAPEKLWSAAALRAEECKETFSHTRPDGRDCFSVLEDFKLDFRAVGENLVWGTGLSPEVALEQWLNSPGHRANIMSGDYTQLAVGYSDGRCVQIFYTPLG